MSDPEGFLARWSRRKRETDEAAPAPPADERSAVAPDAAERQAAPRDDSLPVATPKAEEAAAFDLTKLPPLESIDAATDIRPFLAKGVPDDLARAALRRVWLADPTIRDFVGLAENAWDFTAPNSMAGFGPLLATDDVRRLLAQAMGESKPPETREPEPDTQPGDLATAGDPTQLQVAASELAPTEPMVPSNPAAEVKSATEPLDNVTKYSSDNVAVQNNQSPNDVPVKSARRAHGGALPE